MKSNAIRINQTQVEVRNDRDTAIASVPGGTSTSEREAVELRDNEMRQWHGKGVLRAVDKVNSIIAPLFVGKEIDETNQAFIDRLLLETDRTPDKSRLGNKLNIFSSITKLYRFSHTYWQNENMSLFRLLFPYMSINNYVNETFFIGANSIAAVSMAMARLGAIKNNVPLYRHIGQPFNYLPHNMSNIS